MDYGKSEEGAFEFESINESQKSYLEVIGS